MLVSEILVKNPNIYIFFPFEVMYCLEHSFCLLVFAILCFKSGEGLDHKFSLS